MTTNLQSLLTRVEAATSGDRELDTLIAIAFTPDARKSEEHHWTLFEIGDYRLAYAEPYTSSLDAALALVARVLPEWRPYLENWGVVPGREWRVTLRYWDKRANAWGTTPALAILSVLLRALQTTEVEHG